MLELSASTLAWFQDILQSYVGDSKAHELLQQLSVTPNSKPHYSLHNGFIKFKERLWIDNAPVLHHTIF